MPDAGPQAVLFDMDGLLIDSERMWLEVETEVMAWLGGPWAPSTRRRWSAARWAGPPPTCCP